MHKEQIRDKCIKLQDKYWKYYSSYSSYVNLNINRNKWNKVHQRIAFIDKIYRNNE